MNQEKRIPLAWTVRWRRIRSQAIPAVAFLCRIAHQRLAVAVDGVVGARRGGSRWPAGRHHQPDGRPGDRAAARDTRAVDRVRPRASGRNHCPIDDQQFEASKSLLRRDIKDLHDKLSSRSSRPAATTEGAETSDAVRRAWEFEQSRLADAWNRCCRPAPQVDSTRTWMSSVRTAGTAGKRARPRFAMNWRECARNAVDWTSAGRS